MRGFMTSMFMVDNDDIYIYLLVEPQASSSILFPTIIDLILAYLGISMNTQYLMTHNVFSFSSLLCKAF